MTSTTSATAASAAHESQVGGDTEHNVTRFTDVEFARVMDHVRYRNWSLTADHTGVKVYGAHFVTHTATYAEFFAFINGFNAAGAALGMLGTGSPDPEQDGGE